MCLILLSYDTHPVYRMVLAANRDEFYSRPTAPLDFWDDHPDILAGRDLKCLGVWLGVTRNGRIAAVTNFREPGFQIAGAPSRGLLISDFLVSKESPKQYLEYLELVGNKYNGFNMILGDRTELFYYSNRANRVQTLLPGLYGLSNHLLNTPWPKVQKGKASLAKQLSGKDKIDLEGIFSILKDNTYPPDNMLPDTGAGYKWERILSPLFITSKFYGTRSSSIVLMERNGKITFLERTFVSDGRTVTQGDTRKFSFSLPPLSQQ